VSDNIGNQLPEKFQGALKLRQICSGQNGEKQ